MLSAVPVCRTTLSRRTRHEHMNPAKVERRRVRQLTDLPNVGPATARNLELIGIRVPGQLAGADPFELYERLCRTRCVRQDPCLLDVLISITRFMEGDRPRPWWAYTEARKRRYGPL